MKKQTLVSMLLLLSPLLSRAAIDIPSLPAPLPIFLRSGFSSVLEFEEPPVRVVLGDSQAFQVEKLERSLVLRTLVAYATTNMFVYFKSADPRLFVLTASEEAEPTYFKKIESAKVQAPPRPVQQTRTAPLKLEASRVTSAQFDAKKDYLTVEVRIAAGPNGVLRPKWELVRLRHHSMIKPPFKLWAERKEVQKDSQVRARFIFVKPDVPRDLANALLIIPFDGQLTSLALPLAAGAR